MTYVYSFCVWPAERRRGRPPSDAFLKIFGAMNMRVELEFTEEEFADFRTDLCSDGFTLREIERVPCQRPEHVL